MSSTRLSLLIATPIVILIAIAIAIAGDPGPSNPDTINQNPNDTQGPNTPHAYYAKLIHRDDVIQANAFFLEVKIKPTVPVPVPNVTSHQTTNWPGVVFNEQDTSREVLIKTTVRIRGIDVAASPAGGFPNWHDHQTRTARHRQNWTEGCDLAFAYLFNTELIWLTNPEPHGAIIICDMFLELGGVSVDFSRLLINAGYALPELEDAFYDWGQKIPTPIPVPNGG